MQFDEHTFPLKIHLHYPLPFSNQKLCNRQWWLLWFHWQFITLVTVMQSEPPSSILHMSALSDHVSPMVLVNSQNLPSPRHNPGSISAHYLTILGLHPTDPYTTSENPPGPSSIPINQPNPSHQTNLQNTRVQIEPNPQNQPENSHQMQTRSKTNITKTKIKLNLSYVILVNTPTIPTTANQALQDPNWRSAVTDEIKWFIMIHGIFPPSPTLWDVGGFSKLNNYLMVWLIGLGRDSSLKAFTNNLVLISQKKSSQSSNLHTTRKLSFCNELFR